jgi:hypothetical protein
MPRQLFWAAAFLLLLVSTAALAQERNEVAVTIGRTFTSDQAVPGTNFFENRIRFGKGLTFEGTFARKYKDFRVAAISIEVPAAINLDEDLHYGQNSIPESYSSIFITPAVRANFLSDTFLSPWVSVGGGFGHFKENSKLLYGGKNPGSTGTTVGVVQFGLGLDVKVASRWIARAEVRDFYSGVPDLNVNTGRSRQHNYFVGGGLAYRF